MTSGASDSFSSWVSVPDSANGSAPPNPRVTALRSTWALAPKWMITAAGIFLGSLLGYRAVSSCVSGGFDRSVAMNAFVSALCFAYTGMDRIFYLSNRGIVSETRCWGRTVRKMAPWNAVRCVWLVHGNKCFTVAFEVGARRLKLPFPKDSAGEIEELLEELLPDGARIIRPAR